VLCGFSFIKLRPSLVTPLALLSVFAVAIAGYQCANRLLIWFPWAILSLIVVPIAWGWSVLYNSIVLYIQQRLLRETLSRILPPKLVKIFANRPEFLKTGAEKQLVTILFSDIANFTSLSEGMDSDELAKLVNSYFDRAVPSCIFQTDGAVMKFIGDSIFAIWNATEPQPDHQLRACRAALLLRDQMVGFTIGNSTESLRTRIGLHTGVANVGNFGSTERFGYDAIGENVNLASRMEGLNKYLGTDVLITGDTCREVAGQLVTRRLGLFRLKGFEKAVEVHELISELDKAAESQAWRGLFAKGLECFERKSFEQAEANLRRTLEAKPADGPSKFYLERIAELREQTGAGEWTGIIELKEK
jgi:adenylate cyclase